MSEKLEKIDSVEAPMETNSNNYCYPIFIPYISQGEYVGVIKVSYLVPRCEEFEVEKLSNGFPNLPSQYKWRGDGYGFTYFISDGEAGVKFRVKCKTPKPGYTFSEEPQWHYTELGYAMEAIPNKPTFGKQEPTPTITVLYWTFPDNATSIKIFRNGTELVHEDDGSGSITVTTPGNYTAQAFNGEIPGKVSDTVVVD